MLNPRTDRLDYGDKLRSPPGFELTYALATSYSLELDTLLCLPMALSFDATLEGDWREKELALLEAIGTLKGRLKVFFQQGCIKVPRQFHKLFTLLEPCLVPMVPTQAYSSFHPKIWLLRFTNDSRDVHYRLLVLSRNLTFDRSWDLAIALEGRLTNTVKSESESQGLLDLLGDLAPQAKDFVQAFKCFKKELPKVEWQRPVGFHGLKTLAGVHSRMPLDFGSGTDTVLVMSPFLHAEALTMLRARGARHWLFSRAEELERLGAALLEGWECFALNARVVEGEDELEDRKPQNLHAKLILVQNGATSHWHVGSANATKAALGGTSPGSARNTEFMLRLSSSSPEYCAEQLKTQWVGTADNPTRIFLPYSFDLSAVREPADDELVSREVLQTLISAKWRLSAHPDETGSYTCAMECSAELLVLPIGVEVQLLAGSKRQPLAAQISWEGLGLTDLTAFLVLRLTANGESVERVVKAELDIVGGDGRERQIVAGLIDSPQKLMAYLHMLLQPSREKGEWPTNDQGGTINTPADGLEAFMSGRVYESLLRCAAREPEKLNRIEAVLEHLREIEDRIPADFSTLWKHFKPFMVKERS
ncbi:hypothetical protein PVE_R1G5328 [Pseudomonas veronii 1YdBTEX2]|uniref:PLD phosphodiesterase domain-containing protein n=1 Tax=Pseudomonas veronii 1YdBTEX2 TaxID=1295141 RepID=A0A1D3K4F3_PSEVE|nr:phospholipase D family protein [Pseudomonas veronii]SBW83209.1 hypothetical protein PVE_R1G5328 [Pseudomonas veronii 1YdBTEX2]